MGLLKNIYNDYSSPDAQKWLKGKERTYKIHKNYGPEGLLGHYLLNRYLHDTNPKWNVDLAKKRINWKPSKKLDLYVEPDTTQGKGIQIGGKFKF